MLEKITGICLQQVILGTCNFSQNLVSICSFYFDSFSSSPMQSAFPLFGAPMMQVWTFGPLNVTLCACFYLPSILLVVVTYFRFLYSTLHRIRKSYQLLQPAMPAMPAMSAMPAMPAIPAMSAMPAMPAMPTIPGTYGSPMMQV